MRMARCHSPFEFWSEQARFIQEVISDYAAPKKRGRPPASANSGGNGRKGRRGKEKAKYRDPKTNETWSGRGRMASWLKSKQDAGEKIEKYLI